MDETTTVRISVADLQRLRRLQLQEWERTGRKRSLAWLVHTMIGIVYEKN
jgi:hypothetical protein